MYFTIPFKAAGLITVLYMGLLAFMSISVLQSYVMILAERFVPSAVNVASAINIAAFQAGIALGSYLGGVVTDSIGLIHTTWIGAVMILCGVCCFICMGTFFGDEGKQGG